MAAPFNISFRECSVTSVRARVFNIRARELSSSSTLLRALKLVISVKRYVATTTRKRCTKARERAFFLRCGSRSFPLSICKLESSEFCSEFAKVRARVTRTELLSFRVSNLFLRVQGFTGGDRDREGVNFFFLRSTGITSDGTSVRCIIY